MARLAAVRCETEDAADVLRWTDRMLIRVCQVKGLAEHVGLCLLLP